MSGQPMNDPPSPKNTGPQSPTVADELFQRPIIGRTATIPSIAIRKAGVPQASAVVHKKFRKVRRPKYANGWL